MKTIERARVRAYATCEGGKACIHCADCSHPAYAHATHGSFLGCRTSGCACKHFRAAHELPVRVEVPVIVDDGIVLDEDADDTSVVVDLDREVREPIFLGGSTDTDVS